jgi:hypothetical protein
MAKRETSRPCLEQSIRGNKKGSEDWTEIFEVRSNVKKEEKVQL